MPKETIQATRHPGLGSLAIEVQWGRDTDVRLASVNTDCDRRFSPEYGWFAELSREQINQLIRILRKARDQAYGADE